MRSSLRTGVALSLLLAVALSGCFAFGRRGRDIDRTPIVNTGAGATIIEPGGAGPSYQPGGHVWGAPGGTVAVPSARNPAPEHGGAPPPGPGAAPTARRATSSGPAGGGGSVTFLGGSETDEVGHVEYREEPRWARYLLLPFALLAAPFERGAEALLGEPEAGPELPRPHTPAPPAHAPPPARDYDSLRLAELERELDARQAERVQQEALRQASAGRDPARAELTIADELARLQRTPQTPSGGLPPLASAPPPPAGASPRPGIVDRDGDGRVDQWLFRRDGRLVREVRDDDFDGRPERTLYYDPTSGALLRVEEDADGDAALDTWTEYRDGSVTSRRNDADSDGRVDTWSFFHAGELARIERDTSGDGHPDSMAHYGSDGRLAREERDLDGNGSPELTIRYGPDQRIATREEDLDGDGRIDVISHYEHGRLRRRELLSAEDVQPQARRD